MRSASCFSSVVLIVGLSSIACDRPAASAAAAGSEMSPAVIEPYLKIGAALAADRMDGVTANAGEIARAASALGAPGSRIGTAAAQLTGAAALQDARETFGVLSEAIDSYMTNQHLTSPEGVRVAFCPMVLKPWLQKDGDVRNPYYGGQMLTCGSFRNN